jgi:hypothetical protein
MADGQSFGETVLYQSNGKRTATVATRTYCQLFLLSKNSVNMAFSTRPDVRFLPPPLAGAMTCERLGDCEAHPVQVTAAPSNQGHVQVFQHVKNRARALFAELQRREDDTGSRLDTKAMELCPGEVKARRDSDQPTNERAPDAAWAANSPMCHETGPSQASLDDPGSSDVHQGSYSAAGSAMISSGDQLRELYMNMRHMCVACDP